MALYIPPAVNMLIPRGTFGGAGQQPRIRPIILILHTNASNTSLAGAASLMANTTKGQEYHFQQEAPGTGRIAGRLGQYVDMEIRADNNYRANSFMRNGVLCGAISVETADHGSPYEKSWTDLGQRQALEDLCVWICQHLPVPAVRCPGPFEPGIGYHSMWGYNTSSNMNVNPWTNAVGKICPGPGKIREFPDLLAAIQRRVAGGAPTPQPTGDIDEMALLIAPSDGTTNQRNTWFMLVGAQITALPTSQTRTDLVSLAHVAGTLKSANQQPFRNLTVSDIQALITQGWTGPRGAVATDFVGWTIPADPAAASAAVAAGAATEAKRAAETAANNAANCLMSVGPDLKGAVAKIPTTSTPGTPGVQLPIRISLEGTGVPETDA